jgi:hypothetical protein
MEQAMMDSFYRGCQIIITERPDFFDADIFNGPMRRDLLWGFITHAKFQGVGPEEVLAHCYAVVDDKNLWEQERRQ